MIARLAVMAFAILPIAVATADIVIVPRQCARLAEQAGLPKRLNPQYQALAFEMLNRAQATSDEMRIEIYRCQQAVKRLRK